MIFAWTMALIASLQTPGSARPGMGSSFRPAESVRSVTALPVEDDAIEVDGDLSDPAWSEARPFPPLVQVVPRYGAPPTNPTDVRLAFDARGLYVAFDCTMAPEDIRAPFYVRDQQQPSDIVFIEIDPGDDDTNGFWDEFVHDRNTGETWRVSVSSDGVEDEKHSYTPRISGDGRFVIRRLSETSKNGLYTYRYEATDYTDSEKEELGTLQAAKQWCDKRV